MPGNIVTVCASRAKRVFGHRSARFTLRAFKREAHRRNRRQVREACRMGREIPQPKPVTSWEVD